jgi:prepilin-type N-terminal cleavage/methylation domain-containing protein
MRRQASRRPGFTLIEMLVVMLIILLLVGLLLPAVQKARIAAMNARTKSEIAGIGTAVENFKSTYDVKYIPTFFILASNYNPSAGDNAATVKALNESREFYSKVWPKAFLPYPSVAPGPGYTPLNQNNVGRIFLDGNQLLVFLLGGIPPASNPLPAVATAPWPASFQGTRQGFWNSPTSPFAASQAAALAGGQTAPATAQQAKGPFFDFDNNRIDTPFGHFHDPFWKPTNNASDPTIFLSVYYYFSSKYGNDYGYWGAIYQPVLNPGNSAGNATAQGGYGFMNPHVGMDGKYVEANGYQIVSAGRDQVPSPGAWPNAANTGWDLSMIWPGTGGYILPRNATNAPINQYPPFDPTGGGKDDIANWTGNALGSQ